MNDQQQYQGSPQTARYRPARRIAGNVARARPVGLRRKMTIEVAFRLTLLECLAQVAANAPAIFERRNQEGLHQMRVGLRRLQVALKAFGKEYSTPQIRELRRRAKALADNIAPARELDIFIDELLDGPARVSPHDFQNFHARALSARDLAWDRAASTTASREFSEFLDDVALAAESAVQSEERNLRSRDSLRSRGSRSLEKLLRKAQRRGRHPRKLDDRERHRLRIALKSLRYAAEFYLPLYDRKRSERYLRKLKALLEDLGALSDVANLRSTLATLTISDRASDSFASGLLFGWHGLRATRLRKRAIRRWRDFRRVDPFWN